MIKVAVSGCNGKMGQTIVRLCSQSEKLKVVVGFDIFTEKKNDFPVFASYEEYSGDIDVIIDFSNPASLSFLLDFCTSKKIPAVICTTGHSDEQIQAINKASEKIPLFKSGNMSLGINLIMDLLIKAAKVLSDGYDVEIIEKHHNQKIDAPSGTALMLADAVSSALPYNAEYIYTRQPYREKRKKQEIGIHSIRGGTIVGEHEVIFAGLDEIIEIKHTILSREVFAVGALNAAEFMAKQTEPGLYNMSHIVQSRQ